MCVGAHLCFFLYLLSLWVKRAFKYIYIFIIVCLVYLVFIQQQWPPVARLCHHIHNN